MGDDISFGLLSMAVCFDFCSTNIVQLRAPGSLSDRWSSLATIYPLRFHEIYGRWLSYNIKRVFQQKRKKRCILTGFFYIDFYANQKEKKILADKSIIHCFTCDLSDIHNANEAVEYRNNKLAGQIHRFVTFRTAKLK